MPTDPSRTPATPRGFAVRDVARLRAAPGPAAPGPARVADQVAEEVPLALRINGQAFAVMMATPCDLEDFALGFALTEGLIDTPAQLTGIDVQSRLEGLELALTVPADAPAARIDTAQRLLPGRSGCGLCGTRALEDAVRPPPPVASAHRFSLAALERAFAALPAHQPMNAATGAIHAAAWADADGNIVLAREDVGRHNALDKLVGALLRGGPALDNGMLDNGMLLLTSRASYEMVAKAARAGIGFVAAISAPTALAVDLARGAGVCLVGFARPGGCNVYAHPERLQAADAMAGD